MDFIEQWLHISPDGGNGASELLIVTAIVVTIIAIGIGLRRQLPKNLIEFLEQIRKQKNKEGLDT